MSIARSILHFHHFRDKLLIRKKKYDLYVINMHILYDFYKIHMF